MRFGGLGPAYAVRLRLNGKPVVDFLLVIIGNRPFWRGWVSFGQIFM